MKKIFILMFCMILLTGIVSASDWSGIDNYKTFIEEGTYGKIEVWDTATTILFQKDDKKLKEYELTSNTDFCAGWGCEAEGTAILYIDGTLFDDTSFVSRKGEEKDIPFKFYIWVEESHEEEIIDYEQNCKIVKTLVNGTEIEECTNQEVGSHFITRDTSHWEKYNKESLKAGTYRWKINGRVQKGIDIDWVLKSSGIWMDNWAWWNGDYEYCHNISITGGDEVLNDFPTYVELNSTVTTHINTAHWGNFRFVNQSCSDDGSSIPYEIDFNNTNTAGFWVKDSTLETGTNVWSIYVDSSDTITLNEEPEKVWSNNFTGVWHFEGNYLDSLGRMNGSNLGTSAPTLKTSGCAFGSCYQYDGVDDDIEFLYNSVRNTTPSYFEVWSNTTAGDDQSPVVIPTGDGSWNAPYTSSSIYSNAGGYSWDGNVGGVHKGVSDGTANIAFPQSSTMRYFGAGYDGLISKAYRYDKTTNVGDIPDGTIVYFSTKMVTGSRTAQGGFFNGQIDELRLAKVLRNSAWVNRTIDNTDLTLFSFGAEEEGRGISTIQSYPEDYYNSSSNTIGIGCNFTGFGGENITDVTVLVYDSSNNLDYTNTESGLSLVSYNKTWTTTVLTDDTYLWACLGEGLTKEDYAGNRTFTVDTTAPEINITSPIGTINYHISGNNLTLNWSVSDTHLESCWYNYNTTNISVTCLDNSTQFIVTENSNKNLTFYANDSFGNKDSSFTSWNIKVIEINQTYNNETTEGSLETFLANIRLGTGFSIAAVNINYNNSIHSGQSFANGEDTTLRKTDLLVPNVNLNTNLSFYWNITLSDSTHINLTTQNQTVYSLNIDNCSVFTNEILNFTVVDEEKQTLLPNATIEIAVNIYDNTRTVQIMNLSSLYEKVNPLRICLNQNLSAGTSYSLDSIVRYENTNFANEYYNIVNHQFTNETPSQKITLYDLNISDSTEFQLTFTGADFLSVENALVYVNRQYISENKFKTVELPKTDFNGQTILHLVRNDIVYNLQIIKSGEVLGTFENIVAFCEDFTIGDCNIELNAFDSVENVFDYDSSLGIIFSAPEYNETTNKINFDFITSDGTSKLVTLEVSRNDIFGNRSICNDSLTSAGGTLTCDIDPNLDESVLKTNIYVDGVLTVTGSVRLDTSNYGVAGYLIMFIVAISFILMFSGSKTGVLISMGLTLACSIGLGLVSSDLIGIGASGIWLLVIIFVGISKLNAERQA